MHTILIMEISLTINETLLEQALNMSGLGSKNEAVNLALEEFIGRRAREDVILSFNTVEYDENSDYKKLRGK
jgi:Arc/MetJ family transcription regulator